MALTALLLLAGSVVVAQTNGQFVIKIDGHYMAHSGGVITDATTFDPATCLWTSDNTYTQGGTNKNYYYMDGTTPRFLAAPTFAPGGSLTLSNGLPSVSMSVPESPYYYYQWDGGLGRGVQYYGACTDSTYCVDVAGHTWGDGQCWDVYWVAYLDNTWKLSDNYYNLSDVPTGGKFYPVTITEHPQDTTVVSGGLASLTVPAEIEWGSTAASLSALINDYSYEVTQPYTTYVFQGGTHHYYDGHDNAVAPSAAPGTGGTTSLSYAWSLSGEGAQYLTLSNAHAASPTLSYSTQNNTGHKTAIVKLTVTYDNGSKQTATATVLVKTPCQNPTVSANTVVTYAGATVSWVPTATSYKVFWRKQGASTWDEAEVGNVTSYTITGLEFNQTYQYTVQATSCTTTFPTGTYPTFTTLEEPGLMVTGAIFGGGRMADVTGKTEVVIINCDSVGTIFGGNDIAGVVADSSIIVLGVDAGGTYDSYGTTPNNGSIRVGSVYGGGNGFYAYNGSSFSPATSNTYTVPAGGSVTTQSQTNAWDSPVWTNTGADETLTLPSITRTLITVTNNKVKIDTVFGGAKNAYITAGNRNGSDITIDGGTILAVFGGNNIGGGQGYAWHSVTVNATTTNLTANIVNTATTGYGHDFGIRNLFGGGNKVTGSTTDVHINGGQIDNVFAGGNSADIFQANVTVNCAMGGDGTDNTWNKVYSNAIDTYSGGVITPKTDYGWDGINGIYNVRTLYGGNNEAEMKRVPTMTLTSGSIGTVYGGGNAGDMMGNATDNGTGTNTALVINGNDVQYGTHVVMNSDNIIADYLYGGCRMSNVANSTWVELKKGHVGTVYGGCNISGDVGSTRVNLNAPTVPATLDDQEVKGGTYVVAGGNNTDNIVVYKDVFAGSNGYYNCSTDGIHYISDTYFDDPTGQYVGMEIPTHNETNVIVSTGATIKGNVYAGGNMASVGFDDGTGFNRGYPELIGLASVRMDGGLVEQNVYGGGNMASIFGKNEVMVTGGRIMLGLYGGNDRAGQVAEKTNRIMPPEYDIASDGKTSLSAMGIKTYVGVSGNAQVGTVYGGGNGDYPPGSIHYCHDNDNEPIQSYTFVDVHINGGENLGTNGGHIGTVYGGGNGVTIRGDATVFLNVKNPVNTHNHVDTIFGGNNKGDLVIVPDILLLHGQVGTVYGGCNRGAMTADANTVNYLQTIGGYENIGSYVYLRATYEASSDSTHIVDAKVSEAVYGGCRMNGVTRNSLVLVEGGNHRDPNLYGGSDISGTVSGMSRVAVVGGTVGNVYGGGNGNYDYRDNGDVYTIPTSGNSAELVATGITSAPICAQSGADILGGTVGASGNGNQGSVFGGGYGHETSTTGDVTVNIGNATGSPTIYGDIYGGSAMGSVNTSANDVTVVNVLNGNITGDVYGGGLGYYEHGVDSIAATNNGKTYVNIGADNNGTYTGNVTFGTGTYTSAGLPFTNGRIFGGNNQYGSPLDSVFVNIYKTAHGADAAHNLYPTTTGDWNVAKLTTNAGTQTYAIGAVYGGGNLAAYTPTVAERGSVVHVYACDNTIHSVFGGGNAADVGTGTVLPTFSVTNAANTNVIVEGGRIHRVIGGGNGEVAALPAANIFGTASTTVYAGLIDEVYGGANINGSVDAINLLMSNPNSNSYNGCDNYDDEVYGTVFGCANAAPYNKSVTTTIECGVGEIGALYGGSNQNYIGIPDNHNSGVSVTLNLYGGEYVNVFAGSKGTSSTAANIFGDVTLNLYGGKVTNAYGGSDANGNITGTITVNVLDREESNCGLDVTNIYGASNQTAYEPDNGSTRVSPVVNVIHIKNEESGVTYGIRGNVFGGGNLATVTSNPKVNIGYVSSMTIPSGYPIAEANRVAKVTGDVFGGGNQAGVTGNDTVIIRRDNSYANNLFGGGNEAGVTGNPVVIVEDGTVNTGVYGGCNTNGTVTGDIEVNILGGTLGTSSTAMPSGIFGGGYGVATQTSGNVTLNVGDATHEPEIYADIYGGSALGKVHATTSDVTTVNFAKGTLNGNLYGGGLGDNASLGGTHTNVAAEVNGSVVVNIGKDKTGATINGGVILGSVFGANNINGSPKGNVTVNVYSATTDSIFGGGNQSAYEPTTSSIAYPEVNVIGGEVKYKVVGGGNAAGVTANPHINISGGQVCTDNSTRKAGVYGGCNTSGTVTGDITINITGSTTNTTTIGTMTDLEGHNPVSVHGGGYGQATGTVGNITINFGTADEVTTPHCEYPKLNGDLYGGSALGTVNTNVANATTVNVLNGSFGYREYMIGGYPVQFGGNIYGGGLGDADGGHPAKVMGVVHVNIGAPKPDPTDPTSAPLGQASLVHCNVYGCNNAYGSPQENVFVDVYQTAHTPYNVYSYTQTAGQPAEEYAIQNVFGGGNKAHYAPDTNPGDAKKPRVYIHYCENTSEYVYGGGNAADVNTTDVTVEGGRYKFVFGGGNGQVSAANVGDAGVYLTILGGRIGWAFGGCNMHGQVAHNLPSAIHMTTGCTTGDCPCEDQHVVIENYYFGANMATVYGGLTGSDQIVNCGDNFEYKNVYAGSRLATVYGDIELTVNGGHIGNLFGGCEGSQYIEASVKKYPEDWQTNSAAYDQELIDFLQEKFDNGINLAGTGGNITLHLHGGTIGNVFGGCDFRGNVEGVITIIVDSLNQSLTDCRLDIDYVYGGNRLATYKPLDSLNIVSPIIRIQNGHVNGAVFGGSMGGDPTHQFGNGRIVCNPKVEIGDNNPSHSVRIGGMLHSAMTPTLGEGAVFGGGNAGEVKGNTQVILQGNSTIEGNVFGGGKQADVEGSTHVTIVPNNP